MQDSKAFTPEKRHIQIHANERMNCNPNSSTSEKKILDTLPNETERNLQNWYTHPKKKE
jgi:hypothetical protein